MSCPFIITENPVGLFTGGAEDSSEGVTVT